VSGGEGAGDEAAVAGRKEHRPFRANGVEHDENVVHQRLDRRRVRRREALRAAKPAPVADDQPRQARKLAQEAGERRVLPADLDVGDVPLQVEQVEGAGANNLVCKRDLAVPRVADFLGTHGHMLAPDALGTQVAPATVFEVLLRPSRWSSSR
jgi:hypothetical protein